MSVTILDSIIYAYEKYSPQIFLEECKYVKENIKTKNYIDNELKSEPIVRVTVILILIMKNKSDSHNNKQNFLTQ